MDSIWYWTSWVFGLEWHELNVWRTMLRAGLIYILGIIMVRLGGKRFVGKFSAFDIIMAIMIGSILSRAIVTKDYFLAHIAAAFVLTVMHFFFAYIAFRWDWFGTLVKGKPRVLITNGNIQWDAMKKSNISEKDLMCALREASSSEDLTQVSQACLERSGNISVILKTDVA